MDRNPKDFNYWTNVSRNKYSEFYITFGVSRFIKKSFKLHPEAIINKVIDYRQKNCPLQPFFLEQIDSNCIIWPRICTKIRRYLEKCVLGQYDDPVVPNLEGFCPSTQTVKVGESLWINIRKLAEKNYDVLGFHQRIR